MRSVKPKEHPVYKFLKTFGTGTAGYSNRQIAAIMGRPINTITPRIFELRQAGVVVLAGKRKDTYSGIEVSHWRIATEAEENALNAPEVWTHLADIPVGVEVVETTGEWGWHWIRRDGGLFASSSNGSEWSGSQPLIGKEYFVGPVAEVKR
jgi:transposase